MRSSDRSGAEQGSARQDHAVHGNLESTVPAYGQPPVVVVVGCGFGGLATLKALSRGFDVLVIDQNIYTTFQPLLYQVATAGLEPSDVAYSVRAIAGRYGARFRPIGSAGTPARWPKNRSCA